LQERIGEEAGDVLVAHVGENHVLFHREPELTPTVAGGQPTEFVDVKSPKTSHRHVDTDPGAPRLLLRMHP
jgi:hypothetical protein